ncbi:hypothetical protein PybrP1_003235 [[Pythium] brassicae (nom. inval.)]|nr:hypothetical protein PybrP1_003235 [[Pythium] brassicae (nom. inval.)]
MGGNKHKNGIVCTFPGCAKTMRTQKFKIHFSKQHLSPGELYTVEHRRRFEVARDDDGDGASASASAAVPAPAPPLPLAPALHAGLASHAFTDSAIAEGVASSSSSTSSEELAAAAPSPLHQESAALTRAAALSQHLRAADARIGASLGVKRQAAEIAGTATPSSSALASPVAVASATGASAATADASGTYATASGLQDPPRAVLVQYIEMMDVRFHELIQKMGQVIDGQRELIELLRRPLPAETAQLLEQTPALSSADAGAKKRRKSSGGGGSEHENSGAATLL